MREKSKIAFDAAKKYMPGGVNSPVRSFSHLDGNPVFVKSGSGAYITDVDGNQYIDYCMSWGVLIAGHAKKTVMDKVKDKIYQGASFGMPTELETSLAKMVMEAVPSLEMVRFVSSGTEAVMSALRVARAYTKKNKIVKFDGCYHGHADYLLVSAGSGLATHSQSASQGVPADFVNHTISIPYNDIEAVKQVFEKFPNDIAAIIIEPVPANMGLVMPENNFLKQLRQITQQYNSLLVFDEVINGFRVSYGGAQQYFDIQPDLSTFGKIIGGGFPVGAYGGKKEIMSLISPLGGVYQAGTLSGNPIAMCAGLATLEILKSAGFYENLTQKTEEFSKYIKDKLSAFPLQVKWFTSMFTIFFTDQPLHNFADVKKCDAQKFGTFHKTLLDKGIYLAPSQFEANFTSSVHTEADLQKTADLIIEVAKSLY